MTIKLANNVSGFLNTAITASDTGIVLQSGNGASFPSLGAGEYFYATLVSTGNTLEVVKVTARSGDSMTVVRAQDGTSAASFAAGSRLEMRINAAAVRDAIGDVVASQVGFTPVGGIAATDVQAALAEVDSEKIAFTRLDDSDGSSLMGFLQAGTGAQARTVQAKLRETVSVKDFGAVGDGVTDDTAAIQAALDSGATYIHAPKGTYRIGNIICNVRGLKFVGDGIDSTVFDYIGAGDVFTLQGGQQKFADFTVDGNGTTGSCFQTDEAGSGLTSGVFGFDNIYCRDAGYFATFGAFAADSSQADTLFTRCIALRMSGGGVRVRHDQGVNYTWIGCTFAEIMGAVYKFERGGKSMAFNTSVREVGTVLEFTAAGELSDYFALHGVSVDGSTGTAYPQWHKLVDAQRGRIVVSNYSSGNSAAVPTAPLITLNGYGVVKFVDSQVLPVYTWDGATGIPVVELTGASTLTTARFEYDNILLGTYGGPAINFTTFIRRVNTSTYVAAGTVSSWGQRYANQPDLYIAGSVNPAGVADVAVPMFGGLTYVPVNGNYIVTELAITLLTGSIAAGKQINVKLQRNRGGVLSNIVATYVLDSTTVFPRFLIAFGDRISPQVNLLPGDQLRVSVNDGGTAVVATVGVTVGLTKG